MKYDICYLSDKNDGSYLRIIIKHNYLHLSHVLHIYFHSGDFGKVHVAGFLLCEHEHNFLTSASRENRSSEMFVDLFI